MPSTDEATRLATLVITKPRSRTTRTHFELIQTTCPLLNARRVAYAHEGNYSAALADRLRLVKLKAGSRRILIRFCVLLVLMLFSAVFLVVVLRKSAQPPSQSRNRKLKKRTSTLLA
jgi:hypothetical protein